MSEELFEAYPLSVKCICNIEESVINELMSFIIAKSFGSCYNLSDVCLSAVISIQVEESIEIFNLRKFETGVLGNNRL
jgi:hypothetical protein